MGQNEKGKTAQRFLIVEVNIVCASIDADGNVLSANGYTYTYDAENHLLTASGLGVSLSYAYDGDGLRTSKTDNIAGITTDYVWDTQSVSGVPQVVAEIEGGEVVRRYTYGPTGAISQETKVGTDWVARYFGKDGTGSTRMLTDASGTVTDAWDWDAFGNVLTRTGTSQCFLGFDGEYTEPQTGLIYLRARWYDPGVGRFMGMDSFEGDEENPITLHKYLFANANPVNVSDPSGHFGVVSMSCSMAVIGVLSSFPNVAWGQTAKALKKRPYSVNQLLGMTRVTDALKQAWKESNPFYKGSYADSFTKKHEEGGWIYQNPDTEQVSVERVKRPKREYWTKDYDEKTGAFCIDLNNPPPKANEYVIANFHTHPSAESIFFKGPSLGNDDVLAFERGVPGIIAQSIANYSTGTEVISQKNFPYGPIRRSGFSGPRGYPGPAN